ncbi:MAG: FG-GAP-like repeat-containing protein [Pirellulaceae bacterium]
MNSTTDDGFLEWQQNLPPNADSHPEIWHLRGQWARRNGQLRAATRCFLEALSLDPNHGGATFQLSQLLHLEGHEEVAESLARRSQKLSQLRYLLMELRFSYDVEMVRKTVDLLDELGRPLEAAGWCWILQQWNSGHERWAANRLRELHDHLPDDGSLTLAAGRLTADIDRHAYPLPDYELVAKTEVDREIAGVESTSVAFVEVARDVGIDFRYFNGTTATTGLEHILQATGGGIGVIDFDLDRWPDIYFTQSGPFPIVSGQSDYKNQLFRNNGNGTFSEVGSLAFLDNTDFSQGIAVGDFDNDGFPDVYVANFGRNALYKNMGDGTYERYE